MATVEHDGYFAQDREVEPNVSGFNEEYPNKDHMIALLIKTFAIIRDLQLPVDSMWFRKQTSSRSLLRIARNNACVPEDLKDRLLELERNVMENRQNTDSEFYKILFVHVPSNARQDSTSGTSAVLCKVLSGEARDRSVASEFQVEFYCRLVDDVELLRFPL